MSDLAELIKKLSVNANEASSPDKIIFGKIIDCSYYIEHDNRSEYVDRELIIQVSDKFILKEKDPFLLIPKTIKNNLKSKSKPLYFKKGDMVALIRITKGSKYLLLDVV